MQRLFSCLLAAVGLSSQPAFAQLIAYEGTVIAAPAPAAAPVNGTERFVHARPAAIPLGVARFGPFRVLNDNTAALVGVTNERSPTQFIAMMKAYPGINMLHMIECPGTDDDRANLRIGRMIRKAGISTHVPDGGSVRSGAVELFLAGVEHTADPTAEFAVHSWLDDNGMEPDDYAANAPENLAYIDYYKQMGMSDAEARSFYDMTNSVPNNSARWMTVADFSHWIRINRPTTELASAKLETLNLDTAKLDSLLALN